MPTATATAQTHRIPTTALVLGVGGLVPFVACAAASLLTEGFVQAQAWYALTAYGAVILSFLGGVHWGLALRSASDRAPGDQTSRLIISVIPSLIGWAALLMPTDTGLITMALGFGAMLWTDSRAGSEGLTPPWYMRLRWPLSVVVIGCLVAGAVV